MDESHLIKAAQKALNARLSAPSDQGGLVAYRLLKLLDGDSTAALLSVLLTQLDRRKSPDQTSPLHRFGLHGSQELPSGSWTMAAVDSYVAMFAGATTVSLFLHALENQVAAYPDDASTCELCLAVFEAARGDDHFGLGKPFVAFVRSDPGAVYASAVAPHPGDE